MIKEEYSYYDVSDFLDGQIDLLICGIPNPEDRSHFFSDQWLQRNKNILFLKREDEDKLFFNLVENKVSIDSGVIDLCVGTPRMLKYIGVDQKNILLDISSLDNVLIMFLTKLLVSAVMPKSFFAAYIRPERYRKQTGNIGFSLSDKINAVEAVPGFAKRDAEKQTLCAFLGFEGTRLKGVLETVQSIEKLIPIVAFPSGTPEWYNVTILNNMDLLENAETNKSIYKCFSESVFGAYELLDDLISQEEHIVIVPLGTRPHSLACALFACYHEATRIVYDFVIENENRAIGISNITIYHLTSFIKA